MSYVDSATYRADPRSIAAVAVIHAAAGLALVTGLTVTGAMDPPTAPLKGESITVPLPPPPPPEPTIDEQVEPRTSTIIYAPRPPLPLPTSAPNVPISEVVPDAGPIDLVPMGTPSAATGDGEGVLPKATPSPSPLPTFAATKPVPRTSPGTWITDADYRSRWVNEGLTGTARFRLDIGTDGRVTDCRVTRSTGHAALDTATCSLVQRRARFAPAKDSSGRATAGVYESAIVWRLPE
jgi:protein TonB